MKHLRLVCALTIALIGAAAMLEAQGRPGTAPPGPPSTPVAPPSTPPSNPPGSLIDYICSILPVPFLCD
jgi:hypothetical protein